MYSFDPVSGKARINLSGFRGGTLVVRASDYQESKNDENAGGAPAEYPRDTHRHSGRQGY